MHTHKYRHINDGVIAEVTGQWVKCLMYKHEHLSSVTSTDIKNWDCRKCLYWGRGEKITGVFWLHLAV